MTKRIEIHSVSVGGGSPLAFIGGPCIIEGEDFTLSLARKLVELTRRLEVPFIFKASYDKANRTSGTSFRGPGLDEGLKILQRVKNELGCPILADVHTVEEARAAGEVLDVLQIPAFLCRQTDLLLAAAETGKVVNIKKGQFLAPWDAENLVKKVTSMGHDQIMLTERGSSFGYNMLVTDFLSLPVMRSFGYPVVFDVGHSLQMPGASGSQTGGRGTHFALHLARAAAAVGVDALFMEVHPDPPRALSDAATSYPLERVSRFLEQVREIDKRVKDWMEEDEKNVG